MECCFLIGANLHICHGNKADCSFRCKRSEWKFGVVIFRSNGKRRLPFFYLAFQCQSCSDEIRLLCHFISLPFLRRTPVIFVCISFLRLRQMANARVCNSTFNVSLFVHARLRRNFLFQCLFLFCRAQLLLHVFQFKSAPVTVIPSANKRRILRFRVYNLILTYFNSTGTMKTHEEDSKENEIERNNFSKWFSKLETASQSDSQSASRWPTFKCSKFKLQGAVLQNKLAFSLTFQLFSCICIFHRWIFDVAIAMCSVH